MTGHVIELSMNADGVHAEFACELGADGWCHESCAYGCEVWDEYCTTHHPREHVDYCNPIEFITNGGFWYEHYVGEETAPRSGDVLFEWQPEAEWYGWRYADPITE